MFKLTMAHVDDLEGGRRVARCKGTRRATCRVELYMLASP